MKFKDFLLMGIPGYIMGFGISFAIAKFLLGLPATEMSNAVNNGISGLFSTLMGFIMTYLTNKKKFIQKA